MIWGAIIQIDSDFGGAELGRQPGRAQLWVGLALAIDDRLDSSQQGGQVVFRTLTAMGRESIQTGEIIP